MTHPAVRVASWPPWYSPNPYLRLFYSALAAHGIEHVEGLPLDVTALANRGITAVHLHWVQPLWRPSPRSGIRQLRRLYRLRGFLTRLRRSDILLVWTVHNLVEHEATGPVDYLGHRLLHRAADLRIVHSSAAREEVHARYGRGGPLMIMPHGNYDGVLPQPRDRRETRARLGIRDDRRLLLCFGQVRPYKGFDVALSALRHLPPGRYHLVVAGRPIGSVIETEPGVTSIMRNTTDQELSDLLHACDAVLLPYRSVTSSGVLLLALTAGRAVIASDLPYFREILSAVPAAGVMVPAGSAVALAEGIVEFFRGEWRERHGAARSIAERVPWSAVAEPIAQWLHLHARLRQ